MTDPAELESRIAAIEQRLSDRLDPADLRMSRVSSWLEQRWQPDPAVLLGAGEIPRSMLEAAPFASTLPTTPEDGEVATLTLADGVNWTFRYNGDSAHSYKWEFVGGAPLFSENTTLQTRGSTAYGDLSSALMASVTLPAAGDYMVTLGWEGYNSAGSVEVWMSYSIGGTGALDANGLRYGVDVASSRKPAYGRARRKDGLAAGALRAQFRTGSGTLTVDNHFISVLPVRVG